MNEKTLFRLLHISDLHVGASAERWEGLLWQALQAQADHLLITGDLSHEANPLALKQIRDQLHIAGFTPQQMTVIPGNHDLEERSYFVRLFGEPNRTTTLANHAVKLITVDSTQFNPPPWDLTHHPVGRISEEHLRWLQGELMKAASQHHITMVACHHHLLPMAEENLWERLGAAIDVWGPLENREEVLDLVCRYRVAFLLCGHIHTHFAQTITRQQHNLQVISAGAECAGFNFFDFENGSFKGWGRVHICPTCLGFGSEESVALGLVHQLTNPTRSTPCPHCQGCGRLK